MAFVEFRDVCKIYQMGEVEVAAVSGMTFDIERGELVVVVGPSGAGKTTLLNMLGGMDSATSGTIVLDGREISSFNEHDLTYYRRYDIGFVFQFYNLVQNLTAKENVELASQICKDPLDAAEVLNRARNNFVAVVDLAHVRRDEFDALAEFVFDFVETFATSADERAIKVVLKKNFRRRQSDTRRAARDYCRLHESFSVT